MADEHAPAVIPTIVEVGIDYCIVCWNNVGDQYLYDVIVRDSQEDDSSFIGTTIRSYYEIQDTIITIDSLESNTYYKIKIRTTGGNLSPNESFPPLKFKTN
jgi:hypothetical protein